MTRDKNLPLHLKYRPKSFDEMIGNEGLIESLKTILSRESGEVRSFLFTGISGGGKTTLARIIAKEMGCSDKDFHEYNAANVRGIDTIREIADQCRYSPWEGKVKVYLLDEFHRATPDAQSALLKLIEDTPVHARFILCSTNPEKLLKTIKNRCSIFTVSSLRKAHIKKLLNWVCSEENVTVQEDVINKISECCDGSARQALVMLDQVIDIEDDKKALQAIIDLTINDENVLTLCTELLKPSCKWQNLAKIIKGIEDEPEKIRYAVLSYMSKVLLDSANAKAATVIEVFSDSWMYVGRAGLVSSCYLISQS